MTLYIQIVDLMSDGKERTPRDIAEVLFPDLAVSDQKVKASKIASVIAHRAQTWGEFECVGTERTGTGAARKKWRWVD